MAESSSGGSEHQTPKTDVATGIWRLDQRDGPHSFLKGQKYIVSCDELSSYARSFMHVQRTLGIANLHWRTKIIDKKE